MKERTVVWFRGKDLRVADHAPLVDGCKQGEIVPLFVLDPFFFEPERAAQLPHRMQFLLESLTSLKKNLEAKGGTLFVVAGRSHNVVADVAQRCKATRVVAHRWTEPFGRERDRRVASNVGVPFELFEGETLLPPGLLRTGSGKPYSVFTPFARAVRKVLTAPRPHAAPRSLPISNVRAKLRDLLTPIPTLDTLGLEHNPNLLAGGEAAGRKRLQSFLRSRLADYDVARDRMDHDGTSRLSADLKFGTVSVRSTWHAARQAPPSDCRTRFETELLWREFAYANLWDRPELLLFPFREEFELFPWGKHPERLAAWKEGRTGYPVVDAAARQLLREGYVHNRARMISASFLTKHLLVHYRWGEAHFLKYLTDGDWSSNNMGWQWSAGCGVDAAPYFRVFNPVTQGKKFDPDGAYVRRYVPEIAELPTRYVHAPWTAPPEVLASANVRLGETYPAPIVDHAQARAEFLDRAKRCLRAAS